MATNYTQQGAVMDYVASATISSGDVIAIGEQIGIALVDMVSGDTAAVAIEGVFTVAKVSAAVITQGESVIWDSSAEEFDDNAATPASGDISKCCIAMESGAATTTTIDIKLNVGVGTVTA